AGPVEDIKPILATPTRQEMKDRSRKYWLVEQVKLWLCGGGIATLLGGKAANDECSPRKPSSATCPGLVEGTSKKLSASGTERAQKFVAMKPRANGHCGRGLFRHASIMTIFWRAPATALRRSLRSTPRRMVFSAQSTFISTGASTLPSGPCMP